MRKIVIDTERNTVIGSWRMKVMDRLRPARRSGLLLPLILLLSSMTFIRQEAITVFLSVSMTIFLMGVFSVTYLSGQWTRFGLVDYLFGYLRLFGSMVARPLGFAADVRRQQADVSQKPGTPVWPILRGFVIALP